MYRKGFEADPDQWDFLIARYLFLLCGTVGNSLVGRRGFEADPDQWDFLIATRGTYFSCAVPVPLAKVLRIGKVLMRFRINGPF